MRGVGRVPGGTTSGVVSAGTAHGWQLRLTSLTSAMKEKAEIAGAEVPSCRAEGTPRCPPPHPAAPGAGCLPSSLGGTG